MPIFNIKGKSLELVRPSNFKLEKDLQSLIETNMQTVFNCRFVASEFSTGAEHAGRIDTLALSEENNPVIIEYKKVESSELINQSLFYLSWIRDHRGDFQLAANKSLGPNTEIDWSDVRVICLAPGYKKYDLHAVKMMGANIELWQYRLYENNALYLEEVFKRSTSYSRAGAAEIEAKDPVFVAAGKKAAITRANGSYTFEQHIENAEAPTIELVEDLREYMMDLDESVEENPKKFYVAYKVAQNFACMEVHKNKVTLFLKLDPKEVFPLPANARDVSAIGHYGTGNFEYVVKRKEDLNEAQKYIKMAFERVGG